MPRLLGKQQQNGGPYVATFAASLIAKFGAAFALAALTKKAFHGRAGSL